MQRLIHRLLITTVIILIGIALNGCSKKSVLEDTWHCQIEAPENEPCQNIPVITDGILVLKKDGSFYLDASFAACYQHFNSYVTGNFQADIALNKIVELELTAMHVKQDVSDSKNKITDHPRTIAFANLERETGRGSYSDIWGAIRMKGLHQQPVVNRTMRCQPAEKVEKTLEQKNDPSR